MAESIFLKADTNYDFVDCGNGGCELREWKSDTERGFEIKMDNLLGILRCRSSDKRVLIWQAGNTKDVTSEWNYSIGHWKSSDPSLTPTR